MLRAFVTAYPWDLADHLERSLDHLQGEVGITGLHLWANVPPVCELRAGDDRPRILRDSGGLTFQPDGGTLRGTSWRPILCDWARTREAVTNIVAACDARGLELRFALSISDGGRIPLHHPESACVNALGAASHFSGCPNDREVEGYGRAIIDELGRRWEKRAIVLHDFFPAWSDHAHGKWNLPAGCGGVERAALSVCFCESCCQVSAAAGVDVTTARKQTVAIIDGGRPTTEMRCLKAMLTDTPALSAHLAAQWGAVTEMIRRWATPKTDFVIHQVAASTSLSTTAPESLYAAASAAVVQMESPAELEREFVSSSCHHELLLGPGIARDVDESQLVSLLQEAVRKKFQAINVGHAGTRTPREWDAPRKAIRFARRSSES